VSQNSKFFAPQMMYVIMQIKHVRTKHTLIYTPICTIFQCNF